MTTADLTWISILSIAYSLVVFFDMLNMSDDVLVMDIYNGNTNESRFTKQVWASLERLEWQDIGRIIICFNIHYEFMTGVVYGRMRVRKLRGWINLKPGSNWWCNVLRHGQQPEGPGRTRKGPDGTGRYQKNLLRGQPFLTSTFQRISLSVYFYLLFSFFLSFFLSIFISFFQEFKKFQVILV